MEEANPSILCIHQDEIGYLPNPVVLEDKHAREVMNKELPEHAP